MPYLPPVLFYNIWRFVSKGLYNKEQQYLKSLALLSGVLFILGSFFCLLIVAPVTINFFLDFNSQFSFHSASGSSNVIHAGLTTYCSINEYVSFILNLTLAFGIAFQIPLAVLLAGRTGIVAVDRLKLSRKYIFLAIVIFSAIITPPDVVSQLAMTLPMYFLYEFGVLLIILTGSKKENGTGNN